jgi:glutaredoxin
MAPALGAGIISVQIRAFGLVYSDKLLMNFTVYSKPGCPYCIKIQTLLDLNEFEYKVYTLDTDFTRDQFYAEFGEGSTFPQVVLNDQTLGGCSDTIKYLQENDICCNV